MTKKLFSVLSMLTIGLLLAAISVVYAQTTPGGFTDEPDKTMAVAHESFIKKDMSKASEQISKAAAYVKKQADQVAMDSKEGVKKAGDELGKLGQGVKKGTVKSGDELKKVFAKVDHELAKAWHKTATRPRRAERIRAMRSRSPVRASRARPNGLAIS